MSNNVSDLSNLLYQQIEELKSDKQADKNQIKMNNIKKIVVLTGAGISKESGIDTFRDKGGIWEKFDFMEVSHINAWNKNPLTVLNFFNMRRRELKNTEPNDAHRILAQLEVDFDVTIITQNVDNLHERGGSSKIIHLHGEMTKARSSIDPNLMIDIGYNEIKLGEKAPDGSQLRPHVVMFGEQVPLIQTAIDAVKTADIFVIIGTSLNVNPAAGLLEYIKEEIPIYLIDPDDVVCYSKKKIIKIQEKATIGVRIFKDMLYQESVNCQI
jgi:NAD-dependent deacetylase